MERPPDVYVQKLGCVLSVCAFSWVITVKVTDLDGGDVEGTRDPEDRQNHRFVLLV